MLTTKIIVHKIYPGTSARMFPKIETVIFVKADLYDQWKLDPKSVKFEDILVDPSVPVSFKWDYYPKMGYVQNNCPPADERKLWYGHLSDMEIAKMTAEEGWDRTEYKDYQKSQ